MGPLWAFIHSGHFYSASSSATTQKRSRHNTDILCRSFTPKRHRQLRVKNLPKVNTWRLERDSNPQPSGQKASTLPMRHHVPQLYYIGPIYRGSHAGRLASRPIHTDWQLPCRQWRIPSDTSRGYQHQRRATTTAAEALNWIWNS